MKASSAAAATAVLWLTALSSVASESGTPSGSADERLPSRTELETVSRRDLISLGPNSIGSRVIYFM